MRSECEIPTVRFMLFEQPLVIQLLAVELNTESNIIVRICWNSELSVYEESLIVRRVTCYVCYSTAC